MTDAERQKADEYDLKQCGRCAAWIPRTATMCSACGTSSPDARIVSKPKRSPLGLPHAVTVTRCLMAANVVWFLFSLRAQMALVPDTRLGRVLGDGQGFEAGLYASGMYVHELVFERGEWWRVFTAMFLHGGLVHLAVNLYSLNNLGHLAEEVFGGAKTLAIYLVSGVCSALAVTVWFVGVEHRDPRLVPGLVGASGAIFGLAGLLSTFLFRRASPRGREIARQIAISSAAMLLVGFVVPRISQTGHVGGLVPGVLFGLAVREGFSTRLSPAARRNWWALALVLSVAAVVSLAHASFFAFRLGGPR